MNREKLLEDMRELYRQGDIDGLRRKYYLSKAFLTEDDKKNIEPIIEKYRGDIVAYTVSKLNGKIVDD